MNFFKLAPPYIKEVLAHLPTVVLKLVPWRQLFKEVTPNLKKMTENVSADHITLLNQLHCNLDFTNQVPQDFTTIKTPPPPQQGEAILQFYFDQLFSDEKQPVFLDLSSQFFYTDSHNNSMTMVPNNFWTLFTADFKNGLKKLYVGFYHNQEKQFLEGLSAVGLTKNLNKAQTLQLANLFRKHFGEGDQHQHYFQLEAFQDSFFSIFHFMIEHELELDLQFLYLGICLVTMYSTLDQGTYDVRSAFDHSVAQYL